MNPNDTREQAIALHQAIDKQFDRAGLSDLFFVLRIDEENVRGETKRDKARELVLLVEHQGRLPELEQAVQQMAPRGRKARGPRNRRIMIEKVRRDWVQGVLEKSLYHEARIELGWKEQPEAVERPWAMFVQEQGQPAQELPQGARMSQAFDELGGALLILGAPGTGKTTMLLELANDLLGRAVRDLEHPIPVVFHLSSWALEQKPLTEWMMVELNERYNVPKKVARAWVEEEAILPLLDGLDEVAEERRAGCAEAINAYRQEHGLVSMAVCSRTEEYEAMAVQLRLEGAVVIEPLTRGQVDAYLERAGAPLAGVRAALDGDRTLYELLDTPLMLSVVTMTYKGDPAAELHTAGTVEERREHLFCTYVDRMHERRGVEGQYAREQVDRWLAWLAAQMRVHNQSEFLIERMQPDWLLRKGQQQAVHWAPLLASGLGLGAAFGLLEGWTVVRDAATLENSNLVGLTSLVGRWLGYGPGNAIASGLVYGVVLGLAIVLFGTLIGYARSIRPVETLRWSWPIARAELCFALLGGLVYGLLHGLAGGLAPWEDIPTFDRGLEVVVGMATGRLVWLARNRRFARSSSRQDVGQVARNALVYGIGFALLGPVVGRLYTALLSGLDVRCPLVVRCPLARGVTGAVAGLLVGGVLGGLLGGLDAGMIQEGLAARAVPNEGMRRSAANALAVSLVSGLAVALGLVLTHELATGMGGQLHSVRDGVLAGLFIGLSGGLLYGGIPCLQHLILRFLLWRYDLVSWSYARFLDYATDRIFLRKVGGGYIFIHRLLQDYFAELWEREYGGAE